MKAIIVDIDGTLMNIDSRRESATKEDGSVDWSKFLDPKFLESDTPNEWCFELIKAMSAYGYEIIFVTGRPFSLKEITMKQITERFGGDFKIFFRKDGDYRDDTVIKKEIYENEIKGKKEVLFVVDDRGKVVDFWRSIGLTCLQCDVGNY